VGGGGDEMDEKKFLELLSGVGVDPTTLDSEKLGSLADGVKAILGTPTQAELDALAKERETLKARLSGQDTKISAYDQRVKELQAQLTAAQAAQHAQTPMQTQPDFRSALEKELEPIRAAVMEMAEKAKANQAELERQRAINQRREVIDALSKEIPALGDPRFASLLPNTADEAELRAAGELLGTFINKTTEDAYVRVRDGFVPASNPPRVSPGNQEQFITEVGRIRALQQSGKISVAEAQQQMTDLAQLMRPQD